MEPSSAAAAAATSIAVAKSLAPQLQSVIDGMKSGIAKLYEPIHMRRLANAAADVQFVESLDGKSVRALETAYRTRKAYHRARRQMTLAGVAERAMDLLLKASETQQQKQKVPDPAWVEDFEKGAESASGDELKEMWARIFAGEVNRPGSISRRALRQLRDVDRRMAATFSRIFACSLVGRTRFYLTFEKSQDYAGVSLTDLPELDDLGLIRYDSSGLRTPFGMQQSGNIHFFGRSIVATNAVKAVPKTHIVMFTALGMAVARILDTAPNEEYFAHLLEALRAGGLELTVL